LRAHEERAEKASARLEQLTRARDDYEAKYDDIRKKIKELEAELAELSLSLG